MTSQQNPFNDIFQAWGDMSKSNNWWSQANFDDAFKSINLNIQAISKAATSSAESAQSISRRQAEFAQAQMEEFSKAAKEAITPSKNPQANIEKQAKFVKDSIESALKSSREQAEEATKSATQAFDILNKRFNDYISECSDISGAAASKPSAKKAA